MDVEHEQRTGEDRREFAVFYRYGHERRDNTGNRRLTTVEELRACRRASAASDCSGAAERAVDRVNEIAAAFGVETSSLEMVEYDDLVDGAEILRSAEDRRR